MTHNDSALAFFKKKILRDLEKDLEQEQNYKDRIRVKALLNIFTKKAT